MQWAALAEACHALGIRKTAAKEAWDLTESKEGEDGKQWDHLLSHLAIRNNTVGVYILK